MVKTPAIIACLLACVAVAAPNKVLLLRRALPGEKLDYTMTMSFESQGAKVKVNGKATDTVISIKDGILETERSLRDTVLTVDGVDQPMGDVSVTTTRSTTTGEIREVVRKKPTKYDLRVAYATQIAVPYDSVDVGKTWSLESKEPSAKWTYKLEAIEGETGVVSIRYEEKGGVAPISSIGKAWISGKDGHIIRSEFELKNLPLGEQGAPVNLLVSLQSAKR